MADMSELELGGPRKLLFNWTFVFLVILIPIGTGYAWMEHQRTNDLERVSRIARLHSTLDDWQLYDAQIAFCKRVNVIRAKQNVVIQTLKRQGGFPVAGTKTVVCADVILHPTEPRPKRRTE